MFLSPVPNCTLQLASICALLLCQPGVGVSERERGRCSHALSVCLRVCLCDVRVTSRWFLCDPPSRAPGPATGCRARYNTPHNLTSIFMRPLIEVVQL